jgi:hypothetical protein
MLRLRPHLRRTRRRPPRPISPRVPQVRPPCRQAQRMLPQAPPVPRASTTRSPGRGRPSPGQGKGRQRVAPSPPCQGTRSAMQAVRWRSGRSRDQAPQHKNRSPGRPGLPSRPARLAPSRPSCQASRPGRFAQQGQTPPVRTTDGQHPASALARRHRQQSPAVREHPAVGPAARAGRPDGAGSDRSLASLRQ